MHIYDHLSPRDHNRISCSKHCYLLASQRRRSPRDTETKEPFVNIPQKWLLQRNSAKVWRVVSWPGSSYCGYWHRWGKIEIVSETNDPRWKGGQKRTTMTVLQKVTLKWRVFNCVDCLEKSLLIKILGTKVYIIHKICEKMCAGSQFLFQYLTLAKMFFWAH